MKAKKSLGTKTSEKFVRAKKALGQNFLKSKEALSAMIEAGNVNAGDIVLEIGPGKGVLTEKLIFFAGKVIAVEKDEELYEYLKEKFTSEIASGKLNLILGDVMEFDQRTISTKKKIPFKVVANIPYYLTGAIIRKFLESGFAPESLTLLVQKEVAERIVARDKKESILSISAKAYGVPEYIMKVSKKYFSPSPKVDSAIIHIGEISKKRFEKIKEGEFFEVVRAGFAHKRKTLLKNLDMAGFNKENVLKIFEKMTIPLKIRPENLSVEGWFKLSEFLHKKN